jgi:acyl-coenzyme A synthetase/AMP-(fatty) acid ligase
MTAPEPGRSYRLVERDAEAVLFRRGRLEITAGTFLAHAHALAAALPDGAHVVNLCRDRYAFTVTLAAAVLRQLPVLLTGERSEAALETLVQLYPRCIMATDEPITFDRLDLPTMLVPADPPATLDSRNVGNPSVPADRLAAIVFTSGSTGAPAAHLKTWGALAERSIAGGLQFELDATRPASIVGMVPPQHMYGFETTVLLPLHAPASSWCGPAFFTEDIRAGLAAMPEPRILVTTPLQLRGLLAAEGGLPALQAVISATAPLDAALAQSAEQRWGAPVLEIFGATEVGSIASRRTVAGDGWRLYPGVRMTQDDTACMVTAPHAITTGLADEVALLPDGFRLLGRRTDIVKIGGHRATLTALNRTLAELPGVLDGAFVAPDDLDSRSNARLLAVVVAPGRDAAGILADLRTRLDPLFVPRRVVLVDALPRNEMGKLPREALLACIEGASSGTAT